MKRFISFHLVTTFTLISMFSRVPLISGELEKEVFYDVTKEINQNLDGNRTELNLQAFLVNLTGEKSPNVYYSTNKFLHEMESLNAVANLLEQNGLEQSKLYLSFSILNNTQPSRFRYSDIFYDSSGMESAKSVKLLQKHTSGVLIDVNLYYGSCRSLFLESDFKISFPKYAKSIGNKILIGNSKGVGDMQTSLKVGLVSNEWSYNCPLTKSQQLGADFILSEVKFEPISNFPLTYNQFKKYLWTVKRERGHYFSTKFTEKNETFVFKINLTYNFDQPYLASSTNNIVREFVEKTEQFYFHKLQKYSEIWTKEDKLSDLILQNSLKWSGKDRKDLIEKDWLLPEVKVQEVDVNPCQLKTMLATVAKQFNSVVINEFTWTALARHAGKIGDDICPNSQNMSIYSPSLYLFFTPGIGKIWDVSGNYFEKLLVEKKSICGWNIQTLIFSSSDAGNNINPIVANFAKKMSEEKGYSIGCAVNIQDYSVYGLNTQSEIETYLNSTVIKRCENIWDVTSLIVLQFSPEYQSFNSYSEYYKWTSSILLWKTITARFLSKQYTNIEVILHLTNSINFPSSYGLKKGSNGRISCDREIFKWIEFQREIQSWATIHQIKIVFGNAFYNFEEEDDGRFESAAFGLWNYPNEIGELNKENVVDCNDAV